MPAAIVYDRFSHGLEDRTMKSRYAVVVLSTVTGSALSQIAYETSEDGRVVASLLEPARTEGGQTRGSGVPLPLTPDVEVVLRRQIGGLQIADMNNDGYNDLVAVCFISSSFPPYTDWRDMIFFGGSGGIETLPSWYSAEMTHTGDVQVADLNGDSRLDIVTVHGGSVGSQSVRVYYGSPGGPASSAGYVSSTSPGAWGTSGTLADFDNDGDLDLATSNQGLSPDPYRPNFLFRNDGGILTTSPTWMSGDAAVANGSAAGDFDDDGFPDLAIAKWVIFESGIYYTMSNPGELEAFPSWTVGPLDDDADKGAAVGDFDQDGRLDIAYGGDPSRAYAQTSPGVFTQIWNNTDPFSGAQEIRAHDINNDGWLDLADVHFSTGRMHIYLNRQGVIDQDATWTHDASTVANAFAFGDLNGDGLDDLAVGYSGDTSIRIFYRLPPDCPADYNEDGLVDFFDVQQFLAAFSAQQPEADFNNDNQYDFFDVQAFLDAFSNGCP
jgi:hypothetical protein